MLLQLIRTFYNDGLAHDNLELYEFIENTLNIYGDSNLRHIIRAGQQTLKKQNYITNIDYATWQLI